MDYTLAGIPNIQETMNPATLATGGLVRYMATGGSTSNTGVTDLTSSFNGTDATISGGLTPSLVKGRSYELFGLPGHLIGKAEGGSIQTDQGEHNPEFYSEGGLQHRFVKGDGDGTSDSVPAMLATGEFVIPADVVSSLGNGDNDAGAHILDEFLATIREHKRAADARHLPPDSKGALAYLQEAEKKVG